MSKKLVLAVLCGLVCFACGKPKSEPPPSAQTLPEQDAVAVSPTPPGRDQTMAPQPETPLQLPTPSAPPPQHVAARAQNALQVNVIGEVNPSLTSELRIFVQKHKRLPESFSEFATMRLDSIPRPPEGKRWVIDVQNLQVKAVPGQ